MKMSNLYTIGPAARLAGVCPETVRNYCSQGFLEPLRDASGRRLFTNADIKRIREIFLDNLNRRPPLAGVGVR